MCYEEKGTIWGFHSISPECLTNPASIRILCLDQLDTFRLFLYAPEVHRCVVVAT